MDEEVLFSSVISINNNHWVTTYHSSTTLPCLPAPPCRVRSSSSLSNFPFSGSDWPAGLPIRYTITKSLMGHCKGLALFLPPL